MNREASDEELMTQVRDDRTESLGALFDRHHLALLNFFWRLGNDRALSEDLVQEVFYRILKYRHTYRPGSAFRSWMYEIARNARLDSFRSRRQETDLEHGAIPATAPRDDVQAEQDISLLEQALRQLSHDKREVLVLSRYQDMKYKEIAGILDCQVGAVKVRVHRALQDLKKNFRHLEQQLNAGRVPPTGD